MNIQVNFLIFVLLSDKKYLEFFGLISLLFFACLHCELFQCFLKVLVFHLAMDLLKKGGAALSLGSGSMFGVSEPLLANSSASKLWQITFFKRNTCL